MNKVLSFVLGILSLQIVVSVDLLQSKDGLILAFDDFLNNFFVTKTSTIIVVSTNKDSNHCNEIVERIMMNSKLSILLENDKRLNVPN